MDARRIRPLFLPPRPRRNRYTPLRQTKPAPLRFPGLHKCRENSVSTVSVFLSDPKRKAPDRRRTMGNTVFLSNLNPLTLGFKFVKNDREIYSLTGSE